MTKRTYFSILGVTCVGATLAASAFVRISAGAHAPPVLKGFVHPSVGLSRARFGGIVSEVLAKAGDRVGRGQVLVRFEMKEMDDRMQSLREAEQWIQAAVKSSKALEQVPQQLRHNLYDMHPDTQRAEREYVAALAEFEKAEASNLGATEARLHQAESERIRVRGDLNHLFSATPNREESRTYLTGLARSIVDLKKLQRDNEISAPFSGFLDLLEARVGNNVRPGQPIAILISETAYSADLRVTESELRGLRVGSRLKGWAENERVGIEGCIESIAIRKIPVIERDNLQTNQEHVAVVRIESGRPLSAGSIVTFEIP